ncbi:MAG: 30S ribosomal protein S20 [Fidelibacterota bacterium]
MPVKSRSVLKRQRQQEKRYQRNKRQKSRMRTAVRKVISAANRDQAEPLYRDAVSLIDRLVSKGIIHRNTAARRKSALVRHLNSLS